MNIKFISLNLYEGGLCFNDILSFLEKEKPDIVAFQEVYDGKSVKLDKNLRSIEVLKDFFKGWYYSFAPEFKVIRDEGKIEIGNAVFSKFPIEKSKIKYFGLNYGEFNLIPPDGDYSLQPKNMQCCEIKIKKEIFTVCNVHGIWGLDGGDSDSRLKMSEIIIEEIKHKKNVLLAGDFNVKPNTRTIRNIENHLTNVFKDELETTFNLKKKDLTKYPGYATAVVDMLFASSDITILEHSCPNVNISDHLPLISTFKI